MPNQIFKKSPPSIILFEFLDKFAEKRAKQYVFSKVAFKRARLAKGVRHFCLSLKDYYFPSKQFYLDRPINYKRMATIIRQICKCNAIPFTSNIKYSNSMYEIIYLIFPPLCN